VLVLLYRSFDQAGARPRKVSCRFSKTTTGIRSNLVRFSTRQYRVGTRTAHKEEARKTLEIDYKVKRQMSVRFRQLLGKPNDSSIGAMLIELRVRGV
jgi:hypothetical protein